MIGLAGGEPLTSGTAGVFKIPAEAIIDFDPQVILLGDAAYGVTVDAVKNRSGWNVISAVKTGDIRPIDDVLVTRPGPRLVDGLRALALALHPGAAIPSPQPAASAPAGSGSIAP
jgi:iron complex transport system substrate-binding protein